MRFLFLALVASSCATTKLATPDLGVRVEFMTGEPSTLDVCQFAPDEAGRLEGKCIPYEYLMQDLAHKRRGDKDT